MSDIRALFGKQNSSDGATTTNQKQNKNPVVVAMEKIIQHENARDSESDDDAEEDRKMPADEEIIDADDHIPHNYDQALKSIFESDITEVVMMIVRTSPGTFQDNIVPAAGTCALYELYRSLHPDKKIDFYKAIFVSKDASRHSPDKCVGLAHLMQAIKDHRGLRGKDVTVLMRDCVRITHHPTDLDNVIGTLSEQAKDSGIRSIKFLSGDTLHLEFKVEHQKVYGRDTSLRDLAKVHSHVNVAKALEDNRSKEEIKKQDDINKRTTKLMKKHDDSSRVRIGNMYKAVNEGLPNDVDDELANFSDNLSKHYDDLKNAMGDNEQFAKICEKLMEPVKGSTIKLPDGINTIDKIGYTRVSDGKNRGLLRVGEYTVEDTDRGTIGEAANIPLRQLMSMFAVTEKKDKAENEFAIFLDDGKSRHRETFHPGLVKMLFFAIKLSNNKPTVYVSTVARFGSGNPPVAVKTTVQMLRLLQLELVVTYHIGYNPTDMMDTEWDRVLRMNIIWDEYREEKEERVSKLSTEKQKEHYAFAKLGRAHGSKYVEEFYQLNNYDNKMVAATKSCHESSEEEEDLKPAAKTGTLPSGAKLPAKVTTSKRKRRVDNDNDSDSDYNVDD